MNRIAMMTIVLALAALAGSAESIAQQPPASSEQSPPGDEARRPGRPGPFAQPGRGPTAEQEQAFLDFAKDNLPAMYEQLNELKQTDTEKYQQTLRRMWPRAKRLMNMPAVTREAHLAQARLRMDIFAAAMEYSQASDDASRQAARQKLRTLLAEQFELEQTIRKQRLEKLEAHLKRLREELAQRARDKDTIIDDRVDDVIERVDKADALGPEPGRQPTGP